MTKAETREAITKAFASFDGEVKQLPDAAERYHRADSRFHFLSGPSPLAAKMENVAHRNQIYNYQRAQPLRENTKLTISRQAHHARKAERSGKMKAAQRLERLTTL